MNLKVATMRFGEVEIADDQLYKLAAPLPGFPRTEQFFFIQKDNIKPFEWMQSVQEPEVTFVVVDPRQFFHDYSPDISGFELKELGLKSVDEATMIVIVVLPEDMTKMTANLRGPVLINRETRVMKQVFTESDKYGVRESILEGIKRKEQAVLEQKIK